jgi:predicted dehydrogenase
MISSDSSTDNLVWGLIGCGDVTEVKSAPICFQSPHSELILCMRRDAEKARDYACRHNIANYCSTTKDFYAFSDSTPINCVYIATPPSSHKEYVIEALSKGYNVYIEKPIALNCTEAHEILAVLDSQPGCKLTVAHYRRELPLFQHVKQLLISESIGTVRSCSLKCWKSTPKEDYSASNWRLNPLISGGGYFHDLAPHQLDILVHFFGYPLSNQGITSSPPREQKSSDGDEPNPIVETASDHVYGLSVFPNNIIFNGSWCFAVPEQDALDECIIVGTTGSMTFSFFGSSGVVRMTTTSSLESSSTTNSEASIQEWKFEHPRHIQQPMIQELMTYFSKDTDDDKDNLMNPCSIQDAIAVMKMMDDYTSVPLS